MATKKCRNIYFPKYFVAVRKFTNIKYFPFCTFVNNNGRFTYYALFLVCFIYNTTPTYKSYGPSDRGIVT